MAIHMVEVSKNCAIGNKYSTNIVLVSIGNQLMNHAIFRMS